jgi:hypothetical protein
MADPTRDFDHKGEPIPDNHIIIVSLKDCEFYTKEKEDSLFPQTHYNPENASALFPHRHSRTNMVYGIKRIHSRNGEVYKITTPVYWVEDGHVYQGTIVNVDADLGEYVTPKLLQNAIDEKNALKKWKFSS